VLAGDKDEGERRVSHESSGKASEDNDLEVGDRLGMYPLTHGINIGALRGVPTSILGLSMPKHPLAARLKDPNSVWRRGCSVSDTENGRSFKEKGDEDVDDDEDADLLEVSAVDRVLERIPALAEFAAANLATGGTASSSRHASEPETGGEIATSSVSDREQHQQAREERQQRKQNEDQQHQDFLQQKRQQWQRWREGQTQQDTRVYMWSSSNLTSTTTMRSATNLASDGHGDFGESVVISYGYGPPESENTGGHRSGGGSSSSRHRPKASSTTTDNDEDDDDDDDYDDDSPSSSHHRRSHRREGASSRRNSSGNINSNNNHTNHTNNNNSNSNSNNNNSNGNNSNSNNGSPSVSGDTGASSAAAASSSSRPSEGPLRRQGRRTMGRDGGYVVIPEPPWVTNRAPTAGTGPGGNSDRPPRAFDIMELYQLVGLDSDHSDGEAEVNQRECSNCQEGPPIRGRVWRCNDCPGFYLCSTCHALNENGELDDHPRHHQFSRVRHHDRRRHRRHLMELLSQQERALRGGSSGSGNGRIPGSLRDGHRGSVRMILQVSEDEMIRQAIMASTFGLGSPRQEGPTREELELRAAEVLSRLPRINWGPAQPGQEDRDEECCLCLDEYKDEEEVLELHCRHVFHEACLGPWLVKSLTCPMCKRDLSQTATDADREATPAPASGGDTPTAPPEPGVMPFFFQPI